MFVDGAAECEDKTNNARWRLINMALPNALSRWMPVVTPAKSECRALGPVQTLYESLNRFISLGGNDHIDRQQTGSGRERSESRAGASTIADAT